jgi:ribosome biogenesis GTPase
MPRRTQFVRRKSGTESAEQVIAANVDTAFIVSSLNQELRARRVERYLVAAWDSGAMPVVVLTKADLCDDTEAAVGPIRDVAAGAPVEVVSAVTGAGIEGLRKWLQPRRTVVLIGSSGVGKSTLLNTLAGTELLATQDVREADDKGRHTTTHREIFRLPDGVLLLDTPGMRELGLVEAEAGLDETFDDVAELAARCRFRDCSHVAEPGCAVRVAIDAGTLPIERWESYDKLQKEAAYEERRRDVGAALAEKKRWKQIHKDYRKMPKKR